MNTVKTVLKSICITVVVLGGLVILILSKQVGGYRAFVVQSESMKPTISVGSLVITQKLSPLLFAPGDIVTFIKPDHPQEFITHRIVSATRLGMIPVFYTKGDSNGSRDAWTLVGGGIVGKVIYTIPKLGFWLSLARTKVGIAFLIILPAIWIIGDEIASILQVVKPRQAMPVSLIIIGLVLSHPIPNSRALLSDSAKLINNQFTTALPSPSPTPCGGSTSVIITGNGTGSQNTVVTTQNCSYSSSTFTDTSVQTSIDASSNTGENESSGNISADVNIQSASSSAEVNVVIE